MKKNVYFIAAGAALLALLVGALFFINSKPKQQDLGTDNESAAEQIDKIFNQGANEVDTVVVKNADGEFTVKASYEQEKTTYEISGVGPEQKPSQSVLETFMTELVNLVPEKIVEEACDDLGKYGLQTPTASIKVTFKDDSTKTLFLGNEAPLSLGNYLRIDDGKTVYLLSSVSTEIFVNPKDYYFEKESTE